MPDRKTGTNRNSVRDFRFGSEAGRNVVIDSDLMPAILDVRVEAAPTVADPGLKREIE